MSIIEVGRDGKIKSPHEVMIGIAHGSTFPFFILNLVKNDTKDDHVLKFNVSPEIYDAMINQYGTDKLGFYLSIGERASIEKMAIWSPSMHLTYRILSQQDIMSGVGSWTKNARGFIVNYLNDKTEEVKLPDEKVKERMKKLKEIISYTGLKNEIDENENLFAIARDVIKTQRKDPDSVVYRLAMMIFHSANMAGEPAIKSLENSGSVYLRLMDTYDFPLKYSSIYNELAKITPAARSAVTKTFISFIAGAYIYYTAILRKREGEPDV